MVALDPMPRVGDDQVPDGRLVVVDRRAPVGAVALGRVRLREPRQIVAHRAEVVVDDVEYHAEPGGMCRVDEAHQILGPAVEMRRREPVHSVVAPASRARELVDRHHLDNGDAERGQLRQPLDRRRPRSFRGEGAGVQLVEHRLFDDRAPPRGVGPRKAAEVDDLGRAVRALGLKRRGGVRERVPAVEPQAVARAFLGLRRKSREPALLLGLERYGLAPGGGEDDVHALGRGSPDAEVDPALGRLRADGQATARRQLLHDAVIAQAGPPERWRPGKVRMTGPTGALKGSPGPAGLGAECLVRRGLLGPPRTSPPGPAMVSTDEAK